MMNAGLTRGSPSVDEILFMRFCWLFFHTLLSVQCTRRTEGAPSHLQASIDSLVFLPSVPCWFAWGCSLHGPPGP
jgi:hypothetical protein